MNAWLRASLLVVTLVASRWAAGQEPGCVEQALASPNGPGVRIHKNCKREEGSFRNGELWGPGKVVDSEGRVYEGEFINGRLFGYGKVTYKPPDMRWYEGMFHEGSPEGPGRFRDEYGIVANGFFHHGAILGAGVKTWPHGGRLVGEFRPGIGGLGTLIASLPDGTEHSGEYGPMFGKQQNFRPAAPAAATAAPPAATAAPPAVAAPPTAAAPPAKASEPTKEKSAQEQINKAVDLLRGLLRK